MRCWLPIGSVALVLVLSGCGKTYEDSLKPVGGEARVLPMKDGAGATVKLEPIKAKSFDGVLHGRVTFTNKVSVPPKVQVVPGDKADCLAALKTETNKDDVYDNRWVVGEGLGVENVVVFLRAPDGACFPIDPTGVSKEAAALPALPREVGVDQPFCAFRPQVVVHFPHFYDKDGKLTATGQKPVIRNSGDILHNADLRGADLKYGNSGFNENIPPGSKKDNFVLSAQPSPLSLACSIHPWMKANFWVFDHPYAAKTNAKGEFSIRNLPTDVDLHLVFWHPTAGFFSEGGAAGKKIRVNKGDNVADVTIAPPG